MLVQLLDAIFSTFSLMAKVCSSPRKLKPCSRLRKLDICGVLRMTPTQTLLWNELEELSSREPVPHFCALVLFQTSGVRLKITRFSPSMCCLHLRILTQRDCSSQGKICWKVTNASSIWNT